MRMIRRSVPMDMWVSKRYFFAAWWPRGCRSAKGRDGACDAGLTMAHTGADASGPAGG